VLSFTLMIELQKTSSDLLQRTRNLALMSEEDVRRFAAEAARDRNADDLWWLTEAHLTLHGSAGSRVSVLTLQSYGRYVRELVEAWSGETLLRPSRNAGVLWVRELEAKFKPATVRVKLAAARALYAALRWSGATTADPFSDAKPGKDLTPAWEKREAYSLHEVQWLTKVAEGYTLYIVLLGAHAGLRVSEMTALKWEDINLSEGKLIVKNGKGGKKGTVYLSQTITQELERVPQEQRTGFLLPCRSRQAVYERLESACKMAKVKFKGVHALRHSAGTRIRHEQSDLALVAEHLRHSSLDTARGYAHTDNQRLKKAVEEW
jgi:integrase/recombinase XerC